MPALVGSVQNHGTSGTLTLSYNTAGGGTTAGNLLVACATAFSTTGAGVTGVTLGGSADNWVSLNSVNGLATIWADPDCSGGLTSIAVTMGFSGTLPQLNVFVMEFSGAAPFSPLDQTINAAGTGGFTSGTTPATAQASEIWVGCGGGSGSASFTVSGPGAPWNNLAMITNSNGTSFTRAIAGYQIASITATATYSGTFSPSSGQSAAGSVVTLKAAGAGPSLIIPGPQAVQRASFW